MRSSVNNLTIGRFWRIRISKQAIIETIAALFIILFLYTAINKTLNIQATTKVLRKISIFETYADLIAWSIVLSEYLATLLLFFPATRKLGLYASFVLMVSFTAYIFLMMVLVSDLPCSCGGVLSSLSWKQHLVFNFAFSLLALWGILLYKKVSKRKPGTA